MTPAAAAEALAAELGIRADDAVVVRDLTNVLVHLRPSPVVARVTRTLVGRGLEGLAAELAFADAAARAGAPIVPPADGVEPVPYERDGHLITFWRYVEHRRPEQSDLSAVGTSLRQLHRAVRDLDLNLPRFDRLDEVEAELLRLEPDGAAATADDLAAIGAAIESCRARLDSLELAEQPLHGDVHLGNVLITPDGPLWADLENVCRGPVEYDLACLAWRELVHCADVAAALAAYGAYDAGLVVELMPLLGTFLAVWTIRIAQVAPSPRLATVLRERLDYVRGLD